MVQDWPPVVAQVRVATPGFNLRHTAYGFECVHDGAYPSWRTHLDEEVTTYARWADRHQSQYKQHRAHCNTAIGNVVRAIETGCVTYVTRFVCVRSAPRSLVSAHPRTFPLWKTTCTPQHHGAQSTSHRQTPPHSTANTCTTPRRSTWRRRHRTDLHPDAQQCNASQYNRLECARTHKQPRQSKAVRSTAWPHNTAHINPHQTSTRD